MSVESKIQRIQEVHTMFDALSFAVPVSFYQTKPFGAKGNYASATSAVMLFAGLWLAKIAWEKKCKHSLSWLRVKSFRPFSQTFGTFCRQKGYERPVKEVVAPLPAETRLLIPHGASLTLIG